MHIEAFKSGEWKTNCYVVSDESGDAIIIDPGEEPEEALAYVKTQALRIKAIFATHGHYDHIASAAEMKEQLDAPFYLHRSDFQLLRQANFYRKIFGGKRTVKIPTVDFDFSDCGPLSLGGTSIEVLHTPGHTSGSVALLTDGNLFAGDVILGGRIGRTDLPGGNKDLLQATVRRIYALPPDTRLFPGHGSANTLAESLALNREIAEFIG